MGAIVNTYVENHYVTEVSSAAVSAGLPLESAPSFVNAMRLKMVVENIPGITPGILDAATRESRWVYARAYRLAWWSMVPLIVLAIASLYFIRNVKELMTENVEATVEHVKFMDKVHP